jgi:nicotinate-nucleotide--dimethylbenzimidazole phosphoribosyltransferase
VSPFASLDELRSLCHELPHGDDRAAAVVHARQLTLTKPPGSLGHLEELAAWLARWQARDMPRLDRVEVLVFAGNHGVVAQGVSPYPSEVTAQMVANFARGGAAINQLATNAGATLRVIPLELDKPTRDMTIDAAMDEAAFIAAVSAGYCAVAPQTDLLALGEMGIGNTTAAAAVAAALFGGNGERWAGRGTGVDDAGLARKQAVVNAALLRHAEGLGDPLRIAMTVGGRELAAILGAVVAARLQRIPVLLDGFVCTAAAAPLACLVAGGLDHARAAHVSAEAGHRLLLAALGLNALLDLGMRLGEGSGAALAIPILRASVACHRGMATFSEAGVQDRD